jgi:hypothetical protein
MPNYTLSRTSPPANIYERKINLGYGIKVDTSDAPQPKGKKMEDVKQTVDVAEPVNAAFADGTIFVQDEADYPNPDADLEAKAAEEAKGN